VVAQHYVDEHIQDWYGGRFSTHQFAVISDGMKFIAADDYHEELYDLDTDPYEERNIAPHAMEQSRQYRDLLGHWRASVDVKSHPESASPTMDEETLDQLEALGYVR
jgi:hypothetical protein